MRKEINSQRGIGLRNSSGKERVSEGGKGGDRETRELD